MPLLALGTLSLRQRLTSIRLTASHEHLLLAATKVVNTVDWLQLGYS
ncbi:hypothetical protein [Bacterioplanes sanyensis]|nr:hypothetical protein [Bacterioplanes sanyensis]